MQGTVWNMQETDSISHTPAAAVTIEATPSLALADGTKPWLHDAAALPVPAFMEFEYINRELVEIFSAWSTNHAY